MEDLLVKMIDRCLQDWRQPKFHDENEDSGEKTLAAALYQSQEKLKQLQEEQARLHEYERLQNEITALQTANEHLLRPYQTYEETKQRTASQYAAHKAAIVRKEEENQQLQEQIHRKQGAYENVRFEAEKTELKILNVHLNTSEQKLKPAEAERTEHERAVNEVKHRANFTRAVNKYLSIKEPEAAIREREEIMRKMEEEHQVLFARIRLLGKTLHTLVAAEKERVGEALRTGQSQAKATNAKIMHLQQNLGGIKSRTEDIRKRIAELKRQMAGFDTREKELIQQHERCPKIPPRFSRPDQIEATEKRLATEREAYGRIAGNISEIERRVSANEALEPELEKGMADVARAIGKLQQEIAEKGRHSLIPTSSSTPIQPHSSPCRVKSFSKGCRPKMLQVISIPRSLMSSFTKPFSPRSTSRSTFHHGKLLHTSRSTRRS